MSVIKVSTGQWISMEHKTVIVLTLRGQETSGFIILKVNYNGKW